MAELKKLCTVSSLSTAGSKQELIDRILEYESSKPSLTVAPEEEAELLGEDDVSADDISNIPATENSRTEAVESASSDDKSKDTTPPSISTVKTDISKMTPEEVCSIICRNNLLSQRIAYRKQRFGESTAVPSNGSSRPTLSDPDLEKKLERAKRFGLPVSTIPKSDAERVKTRVERFGSKVSGIVSY